jgi:hypothetical protein
MLKLPGFSVKYPTTIMMVVLAILLLGYISFQRLGIDLLPDLNSPWLFVEVEAGEIPPEEIEEQFVSRMEAIIVRGQNIQNVSSISRVGKALITVEYSWGADMDEAFLDLQKMMADFSQNSEADKITVSQHDPNAAPVVVVALSYDTEPDPESKQPPIKSFSGGIESVGQWVSGLVDQLDDRKAHLGIMLIMMPRLHPETNKNQHKRFAQHIGSPRRGALAAGGIELDKLRQIAENNIRSQLIRLPGAAAVETVCPFGKRAFLEKMFREPSFLLKMKSQFFHCALVIPR